MTKEVKTMTKKRKAWLLTGLLFLAAVAAGIAIYFWNQAKEEELPHGTLVKAVAWEREEGSGAYE